MLFGFVEKSLAQEERNQQLAGRMGAGSHFHQALEQRLILPGFTHHELEPRELERQLGIDQLARFELVVGSAHRANRLDG